MTDSLFFDTDCISAFLWVKNESILTHLYPGKIMIPKHVYNELSYPKISHLKSRIDLMVASNQAEILEIMLGTEEYNTFYQLTTNQGSGIKIIGKGEAASIALARKHNGIVASNNLCDVKEYIEKFELKHTTTADILVEALNKELITEEEGNKIWTSMLMKKRKLGASSFTEYLIKIRL